MYSLLCLHEHGQRAQLGGDCEAERALAQAQMAWVVRDASATAVRRLFTRLVPLVHSLHLDVSLVHAHRCCSCTERARHARAR
eukprot:3399878-Alexandrium_andersonii.AAC.1